MARVQDREIKWRCSLHCEYDDLPEPWSDGPACKRHGLMLRPVVKLPALECETCGNIGIDGGGGIACEGRALDKPHSSRPMRMIWLTAWADGIRERLGDQ